MWAGDILKRNKVTSFHVGKSFRDLNLEEIYKVLDGKRNCKTFTRFFDERFYFLFLKKSWNPLVNRTTSQISFLLQFCSSKINCLPFQISSTVSNNSNKLLLQTVRIYKLSWEEKCMCVRISGGAHRSLILCCTTLAAIIGGSRLELIWMFFERRNPGLSVSQETPETSTSAF